MAKKKWRCFHCDEVFFSVKWAREHFGADQGATPACQIKGHEGHLITYIRQLEDDLAQYRAEDSHVLRAMFSLEVDHRQALIREEEKGYSRGVRDMTAEWQRAISGYCGCSNSPACASHKSGEEA